MKREIDSLRHRSEKLEANIVEIKQQLTQESEKLKHFEQRLAKAKEKLMEMSKEYPWIDNEKQFFGKVETLYCF